MEAKRLREQQLRARDEGWRLWSEGRTLHGAAPYLGPVLRLDLGEGRKRVSVGEKRRRAAAYGRRIARGSAADTRGAWEVERVVDVRRRGTRGLYLEALLRWVSPDPEEPWEDSWVDVNLTMMGRNLRDECWDMWRQRHPSAEEDSRPWPSRERRVRRRRALRHLSEEDSELSDEERELRRLEGGGEVEECEEEQAAEGHSEPRHSAAAAHHDEAVLSDNDDDEIEWQRHEAADGSEQVSTDMSELIDLSGALGNSVGGNRRRAGQGDARGDEQGVVAYAGFTGPGPDAEGRAVQLIRQLVYEREELPLAELERELRRQGLALVEGGLGLEETLRHLSDCGHAAPHEWIVTDAGVGNGLTERVVALI